MKVIISILHYENTKDTVECLNSLLKVDFGNFDVETFVLDNGSENRLLISEKDFTKIGLKLLRSNTNTGFTGGHNLIYEKIQDVNFDYLMLLNNDSLLDVDIFEELVKGFEQEGAGAVVPKVYFTKGREFHKDSYTENEKGRVIWYAGGKIDWAHVQSVHIGVDEVDSGQYDKMRQIDFCSGACLLVKKEAIRKIGLFDEKYFLYFEDADLSVRLIKAGYKLFYVPKAILWHNNAGSSSSGSALHDYYLTRNRMLFGMKYAPLVTRLHLIRESLRLLRGGRVWQKKGIADYYLRRFGIGTFSIDNRQ